MVRCAVIGVAAEPGTIPLLHRLHAVDMSGVRSSHSVATPRGAPIAAGLLVSHEASQILREAGAVVVEIRAWSHWVVINDFRSAEAGGTTIWKGRQDKVHQASATAFRQAVAGGADMPTDIMVATMRATIRAAEGRG
jgi:hypothetical protein